MSKYSKPFTASDRRAPVGSRPPDDRPSRRRPRLGRLPSQSGQATAEYGLVILAAAALAGVLLAWATGTGGVNRLMDAVMDSIIADVTGS